ncbi:MAG: hypothetical protein EXQ63_00250 [Ilumatobacteraceae bacterium]|nr:hypothetical protein [Ilumatobacteraceae bacterium]
MEQSLNRRVAIIFILLAVVAVSVLFLFTHGSGSASVTSNATKRRIDLFASATTVTADAGWSVFEGRTIGKMQLTLADDRVITISDGTYVDDYNSVTACTNFQEQAACVLVADMLGDAVVWFALVQADSKNGTKQLRLPGLVDMQSNGDEGVLGNGWIVALGVGVKRVCPNSETTSLRDFITRFGGPAAVSIVDLEQDIVVQVVCI